MLQGEVLGKRDRILDRIGMLGTRLAEHAMIEAGPIEAGPPTEPSDRLFEQLHDAIRELASWSQQGVRLSA